MSFASKPARGSVERERGPSWGPGTRENGREYKVSPTRSQLSCAPSLARRTTHEDVGERGGRVVDHRDRVGRKDVRVPAPSRKAGQHPHICAGVRRQTHFLRMPDLLNPSSEGSLTWRHRRRVPVSSWCASPSCVSFSSAADEASSNCHSDLLGSEESE